ncbi:MAG: fumarate hydratase [Eggerthellaceae bacterium]
METIITKEQVAQTVRDAIPHLACELPVDVRNALERAAETETSLRGGEVLRQLCVNARIAERDQVPICQDTGTVWICLEIGPDVMVAGDVFADVNRAVGAAYSDARLRKSLVRNAVHDRTNTGDNTPAFCEIHPVAEPGAARLGIMLKGGGSDNASRVTMLVPGAGKQGIIDELLDCIHRKAANACPPLVIGIGIGTTFDKVSGLAKRALMRPIGAAAPNPQDEALERELLSLVNSTGIGPGALGGSTTALAVKVNSGPCHIAALPLAINMGCSAMRRATYDL